MALPRTPSVVRNERIREAREKEELQNLRAEVKKLRELVDLENNTRKKLVWFKEGDSIPPSAKFLGKSHPFVDEKDSSNFYTKYLYEVTEKINKCNCGRC